MRPAIGLVLLSAALVACGAADGNVDASAAPRALDATLTVDATGFSEELAFTVPEGTRSLTVIVEGAPGALYALGSLRTADDAERVGIDLATPPSAAMRASYVDEEVGLMPGALLQSIRLGTFTHLYPYRPGQALPPGATSLRVASDAPGPVRVRVLLPADDGAATLHLNLIAVSDGFTIATPPPFLDETQRLFDQVGITVRVDDVVALPGTGLASISDFTEPQETPTSMSAMLPALVRDTASARALDVFVVDALPPGVGGLSLGTPGPPERGGYYFGVLVLRGANDAETARVIAHEVCHFLALQHVTNVGLSGAVYPDPLDDTAPGQGNLMQNGESLTADQAYALSRSALLQLD